MIGRFSRPHRTRSRCRRAALVVLGVLAVAGVSGCEVDDWLFNPSTVGRWENTPTIVPVLDRLDVIEADRGEQVEYTDVQPEDLLPEPVEYTVGPGDFLTIEIASFLEGEVPAAYERSVDPLGFVDVPQVGRVYVQGLSRVGVEAAIAQAIREAGILRNPSVVVQVPGRRQATFNIYGAVANTGRYNIPSADYRLLDAITDAGGIASTVPYLLLIRTVPLDETFERGLGGGEEPARTTPDLPEPEQTPEERGEDLLELIDELTEPEDDASPGHVGMSVLARSGSDPAPPTRVWDATPGAMSQDGEEPLIDLPDPDADPMRDSGPADDAADDAPGQADDAIRWVFMNGRWVQQTSTPGDGQDGGLPEGEDPLAGGLTAEDLVTQRVIRVPVTPLLQGVASYNVVVRPGDKINVPPATQGQVYITGPGITRPGAYNLPAVGRLTLKRLVASAGGLNDVAIPERVDITRMIGQDRQATLRLNLRAIYEGTHPDIFLKPDDQINIGTNFWATPLAIIRNGFRMSYGFGFLLDRNFGNDVFGPPPVNRRDF